MITTEGVETLTERSSQGRTQAERRAASERRLLDATARLIAERGTSSVSFADIAREAGCSHGLPGYLFGSKTNLLLALVDDFLKLFQEKAVKPALEARPEVDGLELTLTIMQVFLRTLEDPGPHTRAMYVLIGESRGSPPELQAALAKHHDAARRLFITALRVGVERGEVRGDVDPEAQAVVLMGLLRGIGVQVLMDPTAIDIPAVTPEVLASTRRSLAQTGGDDLC